MDEADIGGEEEVFAFGGYGGGGESGGDVWGEELIV